MNSFEQQTFGAMVLHDHALQNAVTGSSRTSLADLSVAEASHLIDSGRLAPDALLQAVFDRIDEVDGVVHSYLREDRAAARAAALASGVRARAGKRLGSLDGIPFAVKDNIRTSALPTTGGSRVPQRHDPALQATLVDRLAAAGAVLVGKLNTWEYGTGTGAVHFDLPAPPAANPWNPAHFTGGSSSGAGAAVAAGTALFAIGTDTGGSVRLPAAACGVVGLKPTFGRISRYGVMTNCPSFDAVGPLAVTVEDCALVYQAIAGHDPADAVSLQHEVENTLVGLERGVAGLRIGYLPTLHATQPPTEPAIADALRRAADALRSAGAEVRDAALPIPPADYRSVALPINRCESSAANLDDFREYGHLMGRSLREKLQAGMAIPAVDYLAARSRRDELAQRTDALFREFDCLLLPMTGRSAPAFADAEAVVDFTAGSAGSLFSLTGHPAISLPAGFTDAGMPVAVQLAGGYHQEALLLRVAQALQSALGFAPRRAPLAIMLRAPATT